MIRVLYVDDEPDLLEIGKIYLEDSGDFSVTTIESATAALVLLKNEQFDAIISDYQMPVMDGIALLKHVRGQSSEIPFIIFTGRGREEIVIEALNNGADFYMQKGGDPTSQFAELRHKVLSAVGRQNAEKKARETTRELTTISDQLIQTMDALAVHEDLYRTLFHEMINGLAVHEIICDENGVPSDYRFLEVNPAFERMTGLCREEIVGKTVLEILPDTEPVWIARYGKVALTGSTDHFDDYSKELDKYFEVSVYQNARGQFTTIMVDVNERKRAEDDLSFKNVILSTQQETSLDAILIVNETGKILSINKRFIEIWDIPEDIIASQSDERALQSVSEKLSDPESFFARVTYLYVHKEEKSYEEILLKDGRVLERFSAPMFGNSGKYYGRVWYFRDITDRIRAGQLLQESEERVRKKLDTLLLPTGDIGTLALADIIDTEAIQFLMNDFYALTQIGIAIIDLSGNILVATGWQDICTKFHRVHPGTCKNCIESDTLLSAKTAPGTFRTYKCKNNLWDVVTPVMAGNNHIGNLFFGQFLFEGEPVDYELFRSQARQYSFDEKEYLAALDRVPRWSKEKVDSAMKFYSRFAVMISKLSHGNIQLARMVTERDLYLSSLRESEKKFRSITESSFDMIALLDLQGNYLYCNPSCARILGYSQEELVGKNLFASIHPDDRENTAAMVQEWMHDKRVNLPVSARIAGKDGSYRSVDHRITLFTGEDGMPEKILVIGQEIQKPGRAEEQTYLKNSESESPVVATGIADNNGIITKVNSAFLKLWGYRSNAEAAGSHMAGFFADKQDAVHVLDTLDRYGRWEGDFSAQRTDGSTFTSHMIATIIWDESGRKTGYHSATLDITEQKRIEDALRESEERYHLFLENFQGIAYQMDGETDEPLLFAGLVEKITGYTAEEFMNGSVRWQTLVHSDDIHGVSALKTRLISSPSFVADSEYRIICKDGTERWVHDIARILGRPDGGRIIITGAAYDVTERRRVEESLRETSNYLKNLLDYANGPIIVWDASLRIIRFNHAFERLTGRRVEDVIGHPVDILFPPKRRETIVPEFLKATGGEDWDSVEIPIVHLNGSLRTVLWNSATLLDKDQRTVVAIIAQGQDITDRKHAEEAFKEANKKLNLLSSITRHDINNQLMVLQGYMRLLSQKVTDPSLEEYFSHITNAGTRISAMIQFTRTYENIGIHAPLWQDTSRITDDMAKDVTLGIVQMANVLPSGAEVYADPLIIKVFYNLMDNAVRYGGKITTIRFSGSERDGNYIIVCEDDGDGVPAEEKEKIFERGHGKNTGLGLFLAREILSITGITIRECGEAGTGARFEMKVPDGSYRINTDASDRPEEKL